MTSPKLSDSWGKLFPHYLRVYLMSQWYSYQSNGIVTNRIDIVIIWIKNLGAFRIPWQVVLRLKTQFHDFPARRSQLWPLGGLLRLWWTYYWSMMVDRHLRALKAVGERFQAGFPFFEEAPRKKPFLFEACFDFNSNFTDTFQLQQVRWSCDWLSCHPRKTRPWLQ